MQAGDPAVADNAAFNVIVIDGIGVRRPVSPEIAVADHSMAVFYIDQITGHFRVQGTVGKGNIRIPAGDGIMIYFFNHHVVEHQGGLIGRNGRYVTYRDRSR